jgi:hypothetical protein
MNETIVKTVQVEKRSDGIAIVKLNRPEAANAFSKQMLSDFRQVLFDLKADDDVRVVIITGSGEKAFCAGADLKERKGMSDAQVRQAVRNIGSVVKAVEDLPQPTIAAINGVAFGGGLELALGCDLRIGATEAKVGLTETSLAAAASFNQPWKSKGTDIHSKTLECRGSSFNRHSRICGSPFRITTKSARTSKCYGEKWAAGIKTSKDSGQPRNTSGLSDRIENRRTRI